MNLDIEKSKRNRGISFHKCKGIKNITDAKKIALKDITEECGENKFYTKNYVNIESEILMACTRVLTVLKIDTTKY